MAFPAYEFVVRDLWESYVHSWLIYTGDELQDWDELSDRERTAVVHAFRFFVDQFDAVHKIAVEAKALRDSGYDGPFIGEAVAPLLRSIAKAENGQ